MTELAQTVNKLAGTKRKREEDDGDVYDGKLPGQRALLSGDKRKKEVGFAHLAKERSLKHMKNLSKWPRSKPFARQYNKELGELMEVESSQLECELQIKKLHRYAQWAIHKAGRARHWLKSDITFASCALVMPCSAMVDACR